MIEIKNVSKSYDDQKVVNSLNFKVEKGVVFGFLGPNGSGKTTTMKMLVGLARPDSGLVTINGKSPLDISTRENIGFMPEEPSFYDYLTGMEFLQFAGRLFDKNYENFESKCASILKKVGIYEAKDKMTRTYSKGMKQRLGFAQAIINDPEYIFLDEPLDLTR